MRRADAPVQPEPPRLWHIAPHFYGIPVERPAKRLSPKEGARRFSVIDASINGQPVMFNFAFNFDL